MLTHNGNITVANKASRGGKSASSRSCLRNRHPAAAEEARPLIGIGGWLLAGSAASTLPAL
jgi:hypothetical protein